jgi:hypothetical protein
LVRENSLFYTREPADSDLICFTTVGVRPIQIPDDQWVFGERCDRSTFAWWSSTLPYLGSVVTLHALASITYGYASIVPMSYLQIDCNVPTHQMQITTLHLRIDFNMLHLRINHNGPTLLLQTGAHLLHMHASFTHRGLLLHLKTTHNYTAKKPQHRPRSTHHIMYWYRAVTSHNVLLFPAIQCSHANSSRCQWFYK